MKQILIQIIQVLRRRWLLLAMTPLLFGFRVMPGINTWSIHRDDPTLWVRLCRNLSFTSVNFRSGDPLDGQSSVTMQTALQAILDDYNNVPGSFVRLAAYPTDPANPPSPAPGDSAFTLTAASTRTIDVCFSDQTFTAGRARPKWNSQGRVIGCQIDLNIDDSLKAEVFTSVLTHELGHCLGLDHPQETDDAIMSYYSNAHRLQIDDKMGIVYLYPEEKSFANEQATLGMACTPK